MTHSPTVNRDWPYAYCVSTGMRFAAVSIIFLLAVACPAEDRRFTVWDSIAMTRFSDPYTRDPSGIAKISPNGRHFAVVTSRGLRSNRIESTVWILDVDHVRAFLRNPNMSAAPRPRPLARFSAVPQILFEDSYDSIVSAVQWSQDSRFLFCLAENSRGEEQLYRVSIADGARHPLSPPGYSVDSFDVKGSEVAFTASRSGDKTIERYFRGFALNTDAFALTDLPVSIGDILFSRNRANYRFFFTWVRHAGKERHIPSSGPSLDDYRSHPFALSPDGRFLVELLPVTRVPSHWNLYRPPGTSVNIQVDDPRMISPFNMDHLMQYSLIALTDARVTPLIDGPSASTLGSGDVSKASWSTDGMHILITSTFIPGGNPSGLSKDLSIAPCAAAVVDIRIRNAQCVTPSRFDQRKGQDGPEASAELIDARFGESDQEVQLTFLETGLTSFEKYRYEKDQWRRVRADTIRSDSSLELRQAEVSAEEVSLLIRQDLNNPPTLWASDRWTGNSREIWNPNPQLRGVKLGDASVYRWKDSTGYEWTGGLVKPVDFVPGRRYPLVIQTHGFQPNEFLSDGSYTTAMAAMPLASAGIAVLQVPDRREHSGTEQEAADHVVSFEAAIEKLDAEGIVDPNRVGLIGFSRTCYYVLSALIRDPTRYAAATVADGVDASYMEHRLFRANMGSWDIGIYGGAPNGPGLQRWVASAPNFHLDRVSAPLRIETIGAASLLGEWELYSSLRELEKAVDLIYIRGGQHILQRPLDRLVSQQGNVDWFRFWLTDQMCSASDVPPLDRRWLMLREIDRKGHAGNCEKSHFSRDP